jgi:predicted HicB family RNase H-like nuclease
MTTTIKEKAVYSAGPYKGYYGQAEYDHEAGFFHGEILGTSDVITFQGKTVEELRNAFRGSVDDYLKFCQERGESPQKPCSGKFVVRVSPYSHSKLAALAKVHGKSLNSIVAECLDKAVQEAESSPKMPIPKASRKKRALRRKQRG